MNMLKPNTPEPAAAAPTAKETVPDPIRVVNPTDPDAVVASRAKADDVFRNRRGRDRTRLSDDSRGGSASSSVPYTRTTLG